MIYNPDLTIMNIRNLSGVHPEEVEVLLDACISVDAAGLRRPDFADFADPTKAEEAVHALAVYNTVSGEAFSKAKASAYSSLANKLVRAVANNTDYYTEQIVSGFDKAAAAYQKAVTKLPEEFTLETLAGFSSSEFKAYQEARNTAMELQSIRSELCNFPEYAGGHGFDTSSFSPDHLILHGDTIESWNAVQYGANTVNKDQAFNAIAPKLRYALDHGAVFEVSTPEEAKEHCLNMFTLATA